MYTIVLLSTIVAAVSAQPEMRKCGRIFHPDSPKCCTKLSEPMDSVYRDTRMKECYATPWSPHSCDREICIAKKQGFLSGNSSFDKEALKALIDKGYPGEVKELKAILKEKCVNGNLEQYGPPDVCDLIKLGRCMKTNMMSNCPEWNDSGDCSGIKELVQECSKMFT